MSTFNIAIIGAGGVGKTSFVELFNRKDFKYCPNLNNKSPITVNHQ